MKVMAENYAQSVDIAFSSKQAPDILRVDTGNVPTWVKKATWSPSTVILHRK